MILTEIPLLQESLRALNLSVRCRCRQQGRKEYYTPAEVDRLTEKELKDPAVMAAVRWSMTKWKKH